MENDPEFLPVVVKKNRKPHPSAKKGTRQRRLTINEKVKINEMAKAGLSKMEIARALETSTPTITAYLNEWKQLLPELEKAGEYEKNKGGILSAAEAKVLQSLLKDQKLEEASANNLAYALKQVHDMGRLSRGQSTSINEIRSLNYTRISIDKDSNG
jgi:IS30 family transposase